MTHEAAEQAAFHIRTVHASAFQKLQAQGEIRSPIRDITIMVENCRKDLKAEGLVEQADALLNLTIGDVDPKTIGVDGDARIAEDLGLNPHGHIRTLMDEMVLDLRKQAWDGNAEFQTGYQADALGAGALRKQFADFLNAYVKATHYTEHDTILEYGGLAAAHALSETMDVDNKDRMGRLAYGSYTTFLAPVPGFTVIHAQARRAGMRVIDLPTISETGFSPTADTLSESLDDVPQKSAAILYLTPMNNPSSTVYNLDALTETLRLYTKLQPHGIILNDLAYLETIDENKAHAVMDIFDNPSLAQRTVHLVSMSKMFGYTGLRCAALLTKNSEIHRQLQVTSQVNLATISIETQLQATALWQHVSRSTRQSLFNHFRKRQDALIARLNQHIHSQNTDGAVKLFDASKIHTEVPMYVYTRAAQGIDPMDIFIHTGIAGIPGQVFKDPDSQMVRFSVGKEALARYH